MIVMRAKWLAALLLPAMLLGTLYALMRMAPRTDQGDAQSGDSRSGSGYSSGGDDAPAAPETRAHRPLVMAHRGGAGLWPENTLYAFSRAVELGADVLEMDLHSTSDGVLVVIHDETVDRTTDGSGPVSGMTLDQLKRLDAAYRWSGDGGKSYPFRGRGITVPTLKELFEAFPRARFNIDIKQEQPSVVKPFCRLIREHSMTDKVMIASFDSQALSEFRRECPEVMTGGSPVDVSAFLARTRGGHAEPQAASLRALQVPDSSGGRELLTPEFIEAAHRQKLEVHAWTINDEAAMRRLIALGIDGIITDYPDRLIALLDQPR